MIPLYWMNDFAKIKRCSIDLIHRVYEQKGFRISTRSKILNTLRLEKIGFEGVLGTLKVIVSMHIFVMLRYDDRQLCQEYPKLDRFQDKC